MSRPAPVVLKVGGSLLDLPDLAARLNSVLMEFSGRGVLLAGGGGLADVVRGWHASFGLSEAVAHRLAMGTLGVTADLVTRLLPRAQRCDSPAAVRAAQDQQWTPVVDATAWFERSGGWFEGQPRLSTGLLPESWAVTSDTLAACVAIELGADLELLKSVDLPTGCGFRAAAAAGLVDAAFCRVATELHRVRWRNLRTAGPSLSFGSREMVAPSDAAFPAGPAVRQSGN